MAMESLIPQNFALSPEVAERGLFQLLLDALPGGALLIEADGHVVTANQQAERFLGWPAQSLAGQHIHGLLQCRLDEHGEPPENCPIMQALAGPAAVSRLWVRCRGEVLKPIEFYCSPFPSAREGGVILAFNDITRQLEIERDLRSLASIAEASPIAIVALNEDANVVHANPAMMMLMDRFGFSPDVRPVILPANIEALTKECVLRQTEIGPIETHVSDCWFEWKLVPVAGEPMVRGYGVDLSERKHVELELLKAKIEAETANIAKSQFLANMSHEIRTPLNGIVGMAELLAEGEVADDRREYANTILACAESLMTTMETILEMASLETGKVAVENGCFDLRNFIEITAAPFRRLARQKGLQFNVHVGASVPASLRCDGKLLTQLLANLIGNAIKFTERGTISVGIEQDATAACGAESADIAEAGGNLIFSVRDTGIGLPIEKRGLVFDRFTQVDGSTTRRHGGIGLGLAMAKLSAELMGGTINVDSELGEGSRFWFTLPIKPAGH